MLHLAIEAQELDIVKLILKGISQENRDRLLNLKNNQGVTPLALAQQSLRSGTPVAQEIVNTLQEKLPATAPENTRPIIQPPSLEWPFPVNNEEFINKISEWSNKVNCPITPADFAQLNPLREIIVKLAYMTCCQALSKLSTVGTKGDSIPFVNRDSSEQALFKSLFGRWCTRTKSTFQGKLELSLTI